MVWTPLIWGDSQKAHDFYAAQHVDDIRTSYTDTTCDELTHQLHSIQLPPSVWIMKCWNKNANGKPTEMAETNWNSSRNSFVHSYTGHIQHTQSTHTHTYVHESTNHIAFNAIFAVFRKMNYITACVFHDIWLSLSLSFSDSLVCEHTVVRV